MMMANYHESLEINPNPNCGYIHDHPYRVLIIGCSLSGKAYVLLNLIKVIDLMLAKLIYMSKIHLNHSINFLSTE